MKIFIVTKRKFIKNLCFIFFLITNLICKSCVLLMKINNIPGNALDYKKNKNKTKLHGERDSSLSMSKITPSSSELIRFYGTL